MRRLVVTVRRKFFAPLLGCLLAIGGCGKHPTTQPATEAPASPSPKLDACELITREEIQAIQGSPIKETKSTETSDGMFRVSQCFFTGAELSRSVTLIVTQREANSGDKRSAKDLWEGKFARYKRDEKQGEGDKDKQKGGEEGKRNPPEKIADIGEEAFWIRSGPGGGLYVLKKDAFIFISLGGPDPLESKIDKTKALAQKAIERL